MRCTTMASTCSAGLMCSSRTRSGSSADRSKGCRAALATRAAASSSVPASTTRSGTVTAPASMTCCVGSPAASSSARYTVRSTWWRAMTSHSAASSASGLDASGQPERERQVAGGAGPAKLPKEPEPALSEGQRDHGILHRWVPSAVHTAASGPEWGRRFGRWRRACPSRGASPAAVGLSNTARIGSSAPSRGFAPGQQPGWRASSGRQARRSCRRGRRRQRQAPRRVQPGSRGSRPARRSGPGTQARRPSSTGPCLPSGTSAPRRNRTGTRLNRSAVSPGRPR